MQGIDDTGAGSLDLNGANGEETFIRVAAAAQQLGFEFCTHGLRFALPVTRPRTTFLSTYPPEWLARYGECNYVDIDPTVAHGMRSSEPVVWSDEFFAATPELWREAQAHGIRHGWAISKRDADGSFSMLVLARSEPPITQAELQASEWRMRQLAEMSHVAMKAHMAEDLPADPMLSGREIVVLRWTADGKTASEIADILGISERTVNFHINQSVTKLGANNKVNAAVRAAMRGLLW